MARLRAGNVTICMRHKGIAVHGFIGAALKLGLVQAAICTRIPCDAERGEPLSSGARMIGDDSDCVG